VKNYKRKRQSKIVFLKDDFHAKNHFLERRFAISLFFKLVSKETCLAEKHRKMHFLAKLAEIYASAVLLHVIKGF
jgi:hypothetical protein